MLFFDYFFQEFQNVYKIVLNYNLLIQELFIVNYFSILHQIYYNYHHNTINMHSCNNTVIKKRYVVSLKWHFRIYLKMPQIRNLRKYRKTTTINTVCITVWYKYIISFCFLRFWLEWQFMVSLKEVYINAWRVQLGFSV